MKPCTCTGDEEKALKQIAELRRTIDTIGGTEQANALRRRLDDILTKAYCLLAGVEPKL